MASEIIIIIYVFVVLNCAVDTLVAEFGGRMMNNTSRRPSQDDMDLWNRLLKAFVKLSTELGNACHVMQVTGVLMA